jgi:hypothetical protein
MDHVAGMKPLLSDSESERREVDVRAGHRRGLASVVVSRCMAGILDCVANAGGTQADFDFDVSHVRALVGHRGRAPRLRMR